MKANIITRIATFKEINKTKNITNNTRYVKYEKTGKKSHNQKK